MRRYELLAWPESNQHSLRPAPLICPAGCSASPMSSPFRKNNPVLPLPKSLLYPPPSHSTEGRIAIVMNAGRDAVDAAALGV